MTSRPRRDLPSRLLFVADATHAPDGLDGLVARAAAAGVTFIEVRRKPDAGMGSSGERLREIAACLLAAPHATLLVNDRVDLAVLACAAGAHVGQDDLPVREARRILGAERWLGLSTHDVTQVEASRGLPLDYVAVGPVFASATKSGHAEPLGLAGLEACCARAEVPVVAIGGITPDNAAAVLGAGAACVAVASAVSVGNLESNVARLNEALS